MSRNADISKVKMTFYPMAGSVSEQFSNLLETLQWIDSSKPTSREVYNWLRAKFDLSHYFARDVYTVLFISSGLVRVRNEKCYLTADGKVVLATSSSTTLLEVFEKSFAGVAAFLEILRTQSHLNSETLNATWFDLVKERFPRMKDWSKRTLRNQCRHRIDWLRAMGFITAADGRYSLSEGGWQFVLQCPPEAIAIQRYEVKQQEKQIEKLVLGDFQPFDASAEKTLSLRKILVRDRAFRSIVSTQYDYYCAVCGFRLGAPRGVYEAEAAHIIPKHKHGTDDPRNGICLCGTCHWAFDEGIVTVQAENLSVMTASYLIDTPYRESAQRILHSQGKRIRDVLDGDYAPSIDALQWHNQQIFLG